jgi:hypothetical protein
VYIDGSTRIGQSARRWQRGHDLRRQWGVDNLRFRERRKREWRPARGWLLSHVYSGRDTDGGREHESRRPVSDPASATRSLACRRESLDRRQDFRGRRNRELWRDLWRRATCGWQEGGFRSWRFQGHGFLVRRERQRPVELQCGGFGLRWRWGLGSGRFRQRCCGCDRPRRSVGRSCGAHNHGLGARARNGASGRFRRRLCRRWRRCGRRGLPRRDRFWRNGLRAHRRRLCGGRHGHGHDASLGRCRGWTSTRNRRRCRGCTNRRRSRGCESFRLRRRRGRSGDRRHRRSPFREVHAYLDEVSALATLQPNRFADDVAVGDLVLRIALLAKKLHAGRPFRQTLAGKRTSSSSNGRRQSGPVLRSFGGPPQPIFQETNHAGGENRLPR